MSLTYPYCKLQQAQYTLLRALWTPTWLPSDLWDQYLNLHCLETDYNEGTFDIDPSLRCLSLLRLLGMFLPMIYMPLCK